MKTSLLSKTNSISYCSLLRLQQRRVEHVVREMRRTGLCQQLSDFILSLNCPEANYNTLCSGGSQRMCKTGRMLCYRPIAWLSSSYLFYDIWSSKNVIKLENVISIYCRLFMYCLKTGLVAVFNQGNNNSTSGWTLSPLGHDKINFDRTVSTQGVFLLNLLKQ